MYIKVFLKRTGQALRNKCETYILACPMPIFGATLRAPAVENQAWQHLHSKSIPVADALLVTIGPVTECVMEIGIGWAIGNSFQNVSLGLFQLPFAVAPPNSYIWLPRSFNAATSIPTHQDLKNILRWFRGTVRITLCHTTQLNAASLISLL